MNLGTAHGGKPTPSQQSFNYPDPRRATLRANMSIYAAAQCLERDVVLRPELMMHLQDFHLLLARRCKREGRMAPSHEAILQMLRHHGVAVSGGLIHGVGVRDYVDRYCWQDAAPAAFTASPPAETREATDREAHHCDVDANPRDEPRTTSSLPTPAHTSSTLRDKMRDTIMHHPSVAPLVAWINETTRVTGNDSDTIPLLILRSRYAAHVRTLASPPRLPPPQVGDTVLTTHGVPARRVAGRVMLVGRAWREDALTANEAA
jgi:hypothetical protein